MNVLFVTNRNSSLFIGGIELITIRIATHLSTLYQYNCYLAYSSDIPSDLVYQSCWEKNFNFHDVVLNEDFIKKENIGAIIVQQVPYVISGLRKLIDENKLSVKLIYMQHDCLSVNQKVSVKHTLTHRLKRKKYLGFKELLCLTLFPIYIYIAECRLINRLSPAFNSADRIVILSQRFLSYGSKIIGKKNLHKVRAIANFLTLPEESSISLEIERKSKEVLIISRLCEERKRISIALRIWYLMEKKAETSDWKLVIVGGGDDADFYKALARKLDLKRVIFEGRCDNIVPYYQTASIFMMTSDMEGWGLTLTESLQMGVVPFAFDSFESLHDIIVDNVNGCIVTNNDINEYSMRLLDLMCNSEKRRTMAMNGIKSAQRFTVDKIMSEWKSLIEEN